MKTLVKLLALTAVLGLTVHANAQQAVKKGDKVMLACKEGNGWLSWYSGNWVVLDKATTPGDAGKWIVHTLGTNTHGDVTIQLKNVKSGTLIDGDNDNSVVLDDDDANHWYIPAKWANLGGVPVYPNLAAAKTANIGYKPIYSDYTDWRKFGLSNKGNDVQDVVLRSSDPGLLSATDGKRIYFYFIKAN